MNTDTPTAPAPPPLRGPRLSDHDGHEIGPLGRAIAAAGGAPASVDPGGLGPVVVGKGPLATQLQVRPTEGVGRGRWGTIALVGLGAVLFAMLLVVIAGGSPPKAKPVDDAPPTGALDGAGPAGLITDAGEDLDSIADANARERAAVARRQARAKKVARARARRRAARVAAQRAARRQQARRARPRASSSVASSSAAASGSRAGANTPSSPSSPKRSSSSTSGGSAPAPLVPVT